MLTVLRGVGKTTTALISNSIACFDVACLVPEDFAQMPKRN